MNECRRNQQTSQTSGCHFLSISNNTLHRINTWQVHIVKEILQPLHYTQHEVAMRSYEQSPKENETPKAIGQERSRWEWGGRKPFKCQWVSDKIRVKSTSCSKKTFKITDMEQKLLPSKFKYQEVFSKLNFSSFPWHAFPIHVSLEKDSWLLFSMHV